MIEVNDIVKIIRERNTQGLTGAKMKVVRVNKDSVDVIAIGNIINFPIEDVELFKKSLIKQLDVIPKFYHGTDRKFAQMDKDMRKIFLDNCKAISKKLFYDFCEYWSLDKKNNNLKNLFSENDEEFVQELNSIMGIMYLNQTGIEDYQYEDFYVTTWWPDAVNYAKEAYAGGEIGKTTYILIKAAKKAHKEEWFKGFEDVAEGIYKIGNLPPQPVVYEIPDIDFECLKTEQNESINNYIEGGKLNANSFRYKKEVILNDEYAKNISTDYKDEMDKWKENQ